MIFISKSGKKWFLNKVKRVIGQNKQEVDTYYFTKEKTENYCAELPLGYKPKETIKGLPVIKKI